MNYLKETVESLRKKGYKVKVHHWRMAQEGKLLPVCSFNLGEQPLSGGETEISITTPEGDELIGKSCCSAADSFNYKLGVRIALNRALCKKFGYQNVTQEQVT